MKRKFTIDEFNELLFIRKRNAKKFNIPLANRTDLELIKPLEKHTSTVVSVMNNWYKTSTMSLVSSEIGSETEVTLLGDVFNDEEKEFNEFFNEKLEDSLNYDEFNFKKKHYNDELAFTTKYRNIASKLKYDLLNITYSAYSYIYDKIALNSVEKVYYNKIVFMNPLKPFIMLFIKGITTLDFQIIDSILTLSKNKPFLLGDNLVIDVTKGRHSHNLVKLFCLTDHAMTYTTSDDNYTIGLSCVLSKANEYHNPKWLDEVNVSITGFLALEITDSSIIYDYQFYDDITDLYSSSYFWINVDKDNIYTLPLLLEENHDINL